MLTDHIERIAVIGRGRAGSAIAGRLAERDLLAERDPQLVVLCVPDDVIHEVAAAIPAGPWIAHVSGGTRLTALDPHRRRFSMHPLQTFTLDRGPEQLDGAWAAVSAEGDDGQQLGEWLATTLGLRPFRLADADRPLYHAAAVIASNYLVALHDVAARLFAQVGAPAEGLEPLMRRTIENGFQLTGPIERGDQQTIDAHLAVLAERAPDLELLYRVLADATRR
jgi:predicted short-subunit dehydrogenase-like oxidoreductase (DUF2520 family)